jgi:CIC family chloride channel protein
LDRNGAYRGVLTARALAEALAEDEQQGVPVGSLTQYPPPVTTDTPIERALDALQSSHTPMPVLDPSHTTLLGWLTHQRVLIALRPTSPEGTSTAA